MIGASYFGSRIPRHVAADMAALARRGFGAVLHPIGEHDLAWYRGTLPAIFAASRDAGLVVAASPLTLGNLFGGEAESRFVIDHPDAWQVLDSGHAVPAACPNHPATRALLREWTEVVVAAGAQRVLWEEPHWADPARFGRTDAGAWACRCNACRGRFRGRFGSELPAAMSDELAAFRTGCVHELLAELVARTAELGAAPAVCAPPDDPDAWDALAALPGLDALAATPYWKALGLPVDPCVGEAARGGGGGALRRRRPRPRRPQPALAAGVPARRRRRARPRARGRPRTPRRRRRAVGVGLRGVRGDECDGLRAARARVGCAVRRAQRVTRSGS